MKRREVIYGLTASLAIGRGLPAGAQATRARKVVLFPLRLLAGADEVIK